MYHIYFFNFSYPLSLSFHIYFMLQIITTICFQSFTFALFNVSHIFSSVYHSTFFRLPHLPSSIRHLYFLKPIVFSTFSVPHLQYKIYHVTFTVHNILCNIYSIKYIMSHLQYKMCRPFFFNLSHLLFFSVTHLLFSSYQFHFLLQLYYLLFFQLII